LAVAAGTQGPMTSAENA